MDLAINKKVNKPNTRKEREVWEACEKINLENRTITYYAIGEELIKMGYRRGSNSDIRRYLKTWRKKQSFMTSTRAPVEDEQRSLEEQSIAFGKTNTPLSEEKLILKLISYYQHHLEQVDRLIRVIELLKKENQLLRKKINYLSSKASLKEEPVKSKPRIIYRPPN